MLASAFLVVAAATRHARQPAPSELVPLTCDEVQHLFAALIAAPVADAGHRLRWSWRRRRQQALPLPTPSRPAAMKTTISGWGTKRPLRRRS
jgi:hypothetical protein